MSLEKAKVHFRTFGMEDRIQEFDSPAAHTPSVGQSAQEGLAAP